VIKTKKNEEEEREESVAYENKFNIMIKDHLHPTKKHLFFIFKEKELRKIRMSNEMIWNMFNRPSIHFIDLFFFFLITLERIS
jgi:hypothetical protein